MLSEYSPAALAPPPVPLEPRGRKYRSPTRDLVARAIAGDAPALSRLLEEQRPRIVSLARFFGGRDAAEDLAQDILLRLMQALPTLESAETFDVWVYRLSRNRCVDLFRRRRLEAGWPEQAEPETVMWHAPTPSVEEAYEAGEDVRRLRAAIGALPRVWRSAIVLRDLQDLSYDEVAARLGVPIGTVKSRINRGRARLAAALAPAAGTLRGLPPLGAA